MKHCVFSPVNTQYIKVDSKVNFILTKKFEIIESGHILHFARRPLHQSHRRPPRRAAPRSGGSEPAPDFCQETDPRVEPDQAPARDRKRPLSPVRHLHLVATNQALLRVQQVRRRIRPSLQMAQPGKCNKVTTKFLEATNYQNFGSCA
jgi:hypothetical protein